MSFFRYSAGSSESIRKKIKIYVILVVITFVGLWMRVWYLQILKGEDFMGRSEENRIRKASLPAYRGTIKDRNGETLVNIRPSFNLYVTPEDAKGLSNSLALLSEKIEIDDEKLRADIRQSRSFKNVLIKRDVGRKEVAYVEENKMQLPGIHIKVEPLRSYVYNDLAAHTLAILAKFPRKS